MHTIFFFLSFLLFLTSPLNFNLVFCISVTILFLLQTIPLIIRVSEGNYVNFYTFFFFSYFFVNFFYPSILYPIDSTYFSVFNYSFNENLITKGTSLAQLASSSIILGVTKMRKQNLPSYTFNEKSYYSHLSLSVVTLILFIFFIITVGPQFLEGDFTAYSTLSGYFLQLLQCSFLLCSLIFFKYYKYQKNKIIYYLITIGYIFLFISIGDRGPALYLICVILGLFTFYIRKIRLVILLPLAIFGVLTMHFVGIGRTTDVSDQGNIVSRALENNDSNNFIELMYSSTESFVVNSRNLYVGLDYVDENGINMGETMFKSLIAVIPFGQAFIQGLTNKTLYNSAEFFTILNFGPNYPYGLGTNLVADVYISFGVLGIIILFFLFGFIVEYSRTKTISNTGLISSIVYFFFIYFSIYFPRTDYFFALKYIVWTILIFYILKILKILNRRNIT